MGRFLSGRNFSPLINKADIFFQSKTTAIIFFEDYPVQDIHFPLKRGGTAPSPTKRLVVSLLVLPIAKQRKSYPKDLTDCINFQREKTKVPGSVSIDPRASIRTYQRGRNPNSVESMRNSLG